MVSREEPSQKVAFTGRVRQGRRHDGWSRGPPPEVRPRAAGM